MSHSLYKFRIDSAYMRQAVYTTARFGIFLNLTEYVKQKNDGKKPSFAQNCACSLTAGGLGALVGTPADLILIRMQADSTLPVQLNREETILQFSTLSKGSQLRRVFSVFGKEECQQSQEQWP